MLPILFLSLIDRTQRIIVTLLRFNISCTDLPYIYGSGWGRIEIRCIYWDKLLKLALSDHWLFKLKLRPNLGSKFIYDWLTLSTYGIHHSFHICPSSRYSRPSVVVIFLFNLVFLFLQGWLGMCHRICTIKHETHNKILITFGRVHRDRSNV